MTLSRLSMSHDPNNILQNPDAFAAKVTGEPNNPLQNAVSTVTNNGMPAPTNVPGVKNGIPPQMNPGSQDTQNPSDDPLAQYAVKQDNNQNQQQQQDQQQQQQTTNNQQQRQLPSAEDIGKIGQQIAQSIQPPDSETITKILGGDAEAFANFIATQNSQIITKTLHASMLASDTLQQQFGGSQSETIKSQLQAENYVNEATEAATSKSPALAQGIYPQLLQTAIDELRKQYPTAPAALLGERAAQQLMGASPQPDTQEPAPKTNWLQHLGLKK